MASPLEKKLRTWKRRRSDDKLFRELVAAHKLAPRERKLLVALADRYRLSRLSEIFVRPSLMTVSPDRSIWSNAEVQKLRHKLVPTPAARVASAASAQPSTNAAEEPAAKSTPTVADSVPSPTNVERPVATPAGTPQGILTPDRRPDRRPDRHPGDSPAPARISQGEPQPTGTEPAATGSSPTKAVTAAETPDLSTADLIAQLARTHGTLPDGSTTDGATTDRELAHGAPPDSTHSAPQPAENTNSAGPPPAESDSALDASTAFPAARDADTLLVRDAVDDPEVEGLVPVSRE